MCVCVFAFRYESLPLSRAPLESTEGLQPTVGFSASDTTWKGNHIKLYDLGGGPRIRDIWARYYAEVSLHVYKEAVAVTEG